METEDLSDLMPGIDGLVSALIANGANVTLAGDQHAAVQLPEESSKLAMCRAMIGMARDGYLPKHCGSDLWVRHAHDRTRDVG